RQSSRIEVEDFVYALNRIAEDEEHFDSDNSFIELTENETIRSRYEGEDDWFVIFDVMHNVFKAVSLQYIRSIVYYDYYTSDTSLAYEYRALEQSDIFNGLTNGDANGDNYEVVDYDYVTNTFVGRNSGFQYEDEAQVTDVSLMTAELEQREFFKKAANISFALSLSIKTSLSLVTLGQKAELILKKSGRELTEADQSALSADLERLSGVSV